MQSGVWLVTCFYFRGQSNAKEAAWAFLEYYLLEEPSYGFPSVKKYFDEYAEDYLYDQWQRDEDGELILFKNRPQFVRTRSCMDEDRRAGSGVSEVERTVNCGLIYIFPLLMLS